jgi:putative membrane protein
VDSAAAAGLVPADARPIAPDAVVKANVPNTPFLPMTIFTAAISLSLFQEVGTWRFETNKSFDMIAILDRRRARSTCVYRRRINGASKMNRASAAIRVTGLGLTCALFWSAASTAVALAQTAAPPEAPATLNALDFNFVGQANLGAPFQVDSGRLAETKGTDAAIRSYADLMVTSHIPVANALNVILKHKNITPSNTLLHGAYDTMMSTLKTDRGATFDRDYVNGQVEYQKGNAALFEQEIQNGTDPDLKAFARQTLPKIVDHLHRAEKLAAAAGGRLASK